MTESISGLSAIASRYDGFLLDLWGVIHDGSQLYPGVHDTLTQLRSAGKKIIFLSNAPRRAWKVEAVLGQLGIERALYDEVVSSGEAGYQWLQSGKLPSTKYYYIGPDKDADVLDGLGYSAVDGLKEAYFLLNVGFGSEDQSAEDFTQMLTEAKALNLPMLCLNPDLEVVKISGERFPCAGVLAHVYEGMGGKVIWFGKPYPAVYDSCMALLGSLEKSRILAVGDSLETDIPGAVGFGIDSALVLGGILKEKTQREIVELCRELKLTPTYTVPRFTW